VETQATTHTSLEELVGNFERGTTNARNQIRDLIEKDPESFRDGAVRVLKSSPGSRGLQYVVKLLVTSDLLFQTLCDPTLTSQEAISLGRAAAEAEPMIDVTLAKQLAEGVSELKEETACLLLDVLAEISNGNRIMRSLMRMLRQNNPQVRAKAIVMIGRARRSVKWVQSRFAESDPRKRANSVEALWGIDTVEARDALRAGSHDSSNRVAGNALVALHRMGDSWMIPEALKMAASDDWLFRASGAWVMGETGDSRFSGTLGNMMRDANALVRKRAFAALGKIKSATTQSRKGREWKLAASLWDSSGAFRRIRIDTGLGEGGDPPKLTSTQFLLQEDGQLVTKYQVEERTIADTLGIGFLFPRAADSATPPWVAAALRCLQWKRPPDLWRTMFYAKSDPTPEPDSEQPLFTSNAEEAAAALEKQGKCSDFWSALRSSLQALQSAACGGRQLIVYCHEDPGTPRDANEIITFVQTANIAVSAIAAVSNEALENLCRRSQGCFRIAETSDAGRQVEEAYLASLSRFLISYEPLIPEGRSLQIRVFDTAGWGETTITL
jgi:HEAT repeat protein